MTVLVERPALGQGHFCLVVHLQLAAGNDRGGSVEEEVVGLCGHCDRDRVRAEHCQLTEGGDHDRLRVGECETDQTCVARHFCIVACDTEVVGILNRNDTDTAFLCLFDRHLHRFVTDELTHRVVRVDDGGGGGLVYDLGLCIYLDETLFDTLVVANESLHAVRLNAELVGHEQYVGDDAAFGFLKAELFERGHTKVVEGVDGKLYVFSHGSSP